MITTAIILAILKIRSMIREKALLKWARHQKDNIYIVCLDPATGEMMELPEPLPDFVVFAPHGEMNQRAEEVKELLRKGKNVFFENEKYSVAKQIHVIVIKYQHGSNRTETWHGGYTERVISQITNETNERHNLLATSTKKGWYDTYHHNEATPRVNLSSAMSMLYNIVPR